MTKQDVERLFTYHSPLPNSVAAMVEVREAAKHLALTMLRHAPHPDCAIETLHVAIMIANSDIIQEQAKKSAEADAWLRRDSYRALDRDGADVGTARELIKEREARQALAKDTQPASDGKEYRERG